MMFSKMVLEAAQQLTKGSSCLEFSNLELGV